LKIDWQIAIRTLLYGVQFEANPEAGVQRVLTSLKADPDPTFTQEQFAQAITFALNAPDDLSKLLPQAQSDASVRQFLKAMGQVLPPVSG
jgi:hypothetical protein